MSRPPRLGAAAARLPGAVGVALVTAIMVAMLIAEHYLAGAGQVTSDVAAG
jgi:hypothetical protein